MRESILLWWRSCWWRSLNYILGSRALLGPVRPRLPSTPGPGRSPHSQQKHSGWWSALLSEDSPFLSPWTSDDGASCCLVVLPIAAATPRSSPRSTRSPPGGPETGASCKSRPLGLLHLVDIWWHPWTNSRPTVLVHSSLTTASWMSQHPDHRPCSSEGILERSAPARDSCSIQSFHDAQSSFSAGILHSSVFGHGWAGKTISTPLLSHPWSSGWTGEVAPSSRHRENVPSAQLPQMKMPTWGNVPNFSLTPIRPAYPQLGCYQYHQPIVLGSLWWRLWLIAIN